MWGRKALAVFIIFNGIGVFTSYKVTMYDMASAIIGEDQESLTNLIIVFILVSVVIATLFQHPWEMPDIDLIANGALIALAFALIYLVMISEDIKDSDTSTNPANFSDILCFYFLLFICGSVSDISCCRSKLNDPSWSLGCYN